MPLSVKTEDFLREVIGDVHFAYYYNEVNLSWYGQRKRDGNLEHLWTHFPHRRVTSDDFAPPNGSTRIYPNPEDRETANDKRRRWAAGLRSLHLSSPEIPQPEGVHIAFNRGTLYDHPATQWAVYNANQQREEDLNDILALPVAELQPEPPARQRKETKDVFSRYKPVEVEKSKKLPRFRQQYQTEDEARLRLTESIITLHDKAYWVDQVLTEPKTRKLWVRGHAGNGPEFIPLNETGCDLRTVDCGYLNWGGLAFYLFRNPARVYKQGITHQNSRIIRVGSNNDESRMPNNIDFVNSYNDFKVTEFDKEKLEVYQSFAFSRDIAAYRVKRRDTMDVYVEHRCSKLGKICPDGKLAVTKHTSEVPWIIKALDEVGLNIRVSKDDN